MSVQGWIVVAAFVTLLGLVIVRVNLLRRQGISAFLFGATHKSDAVLVPGILAVIYCIIAPAFGWPIWEPLVAPFWSSDIPSWIGAALCVLADVCLAWTLVSFGDSFRVGIDAQEPGALITTGAFAFSRNPIYVSFAFFLTGLFLVQRNLITLVVPLVFVLIVHHQVLREEKFLEQHYGEQFVAYRQRVRRYL